MHFETLSKANETFNIFSVLHKDHDERRLHSRFLAALLNPAGSHKMNDKFLSIFLNIIGLYEIDMNNSNIYPKESDKSENSNIDILIIDKKSKNAIVIENKIFAGDSNNENGGQLERYYNHVKTVTYFNLQQQHFIEADAAVPGLSRNQAYSLFILIPDKSVINEFDKIIKPIFEMVSNLDEQNTQLRQIRDRLLPRLISGKLEVK